MEHSASGQNGEPQNDKATRTYQLTSDKINDKLHK